MFYSLLRIVTSFPFTVFTRISAAAIVKFFGPQMRRLFQSGVYLRAALIQKLTRLRKKNAGRKEERSWASSSLFSKET